MDKPIAWYDPTNGMVSTDKDSPLFTPLGQVLPLYPQSEQEPVAWLHTKIEGVAVPHRPADLDKHPDRWEALYKTPPPCPTCEALARTVMLDQTYHDNLSQQRTWVGLTDEEIKNACDKHTNWFAIALDLEAKLKEKNI